MRTLRHVDEYGRGHRQTGLVPLCVYQHGQPGMVADAAAVGYKSSTRPATGHHDLTRGKANKAYGYTNGMTV